MKSFFYFLLWLALAGLAILLAIVLGDRGAWYFAWMLGTVVIVLVAAAGGVMLDAQDERAAERRAAARGSLPPR